MLMIAAALEEELEIAKSLCGGVGRIHGEGARLWEGTLDGERVILLRAGVGPMRSAERLQSALRQTKPSQILVIGYAGALDPALKLGDLVAIRKAIALQMDEHLPGWEHARVAGEFQLMPCEAAISAEPEDARIPVEADLLTSAHVLGNPAHKRCLREKFGAAAVDMETASLARVAGDERLPLSCVRVISDTADDTFLAPFSYDPSAGMAARAKQLMHTGMTETYREWKRHTATARESLARFLSCHLGIFVRHCADIASKRSTSA
jgi:adenosylhomocysteine nucleosidase